MSLKRSLKSIRKGIVHKDRAFRTIRTLYTHLSEFSNDEILDYYGVKNLKELEQLSGYFCIDSQREFKYLYSTKKEAEQQAKYKFNNLSSM